MDPISVGMIVRSLDDRLIGKVSGLHGCCVSFSLLETGDTTSATWSGVYNSQDRIVSLIYVHGEAHRYVCSSHPATVHRISDTAIGWAVGVGPQSTRRFSAGPTANQNQEYWRPTPALRERAQRAKTSV